MSRTAPSRCLLLATACALAGLVLAGCNKSNDQGSSLAPLPLATGPAAPSSPAPAATALPEAPAAAYVESAPDDDYAYAARAYALSQAFGDAPPDYAYDYDDEEPWVWRSGDGYIRIAERLPNGGLRFFYYQPGAEQPFLVEDDGYDYAYSNGDLIGVYAPSGAWLPAPEAQGRLAVAGRFLAWGAQLYGASMRQPHVAAAQADWRNERNVIANDQRQWSAQQDDNPGWRAYIQSHGNPDQAHWADERGRRAQEAASFARSVGDQAGVARAEQAQQQAQAARARPTPPPSAGPVRRPTPGATPERGPPGARAPLAAPERTAPRSRAMPAGRPPTAPSVREPARPPPPRPEAQPSRPPPAIRPQARPASPAARAGIPAARPPPPARHPPPASKGPPPKKPDEK